MRGLWHFHVTHTNQKRTQGKKVMDAHTLGPVDVVVLCECGFNHRLIGAQDNSDKMQGSGHGSVVPGDDPGSEPPPGEEEEPKWEGNPGSGGEDEET